MEKRFDPFQIDFCCWLKHSQAERLGHGRLNTVVHGVGAGDLQPLGAAVRKQFCAGLDELEATLSLSPFQALRQCQIGKDERFLVIHVFHRRQNACKFSFRHPPNQICTLLR